MAVTEYINETIHLWDNWQEVVAPAAGISSSIDDTVHLRDSVTRAVDGANQYTEYLEDEVHLRDTDLPGVAGAGGLSSSINETVHLRDVLVRDVAIVGIYEVLDDHVHLRDEVSRNVVANVIKTHNENITFGDTKDVGYKEYSHRFRWTNYNGIAVPDLNYKDLKEPITKIIPAPSFLQFKYENSFIIFTRNTINRFVLNSDVETGQWRAQTDNLIEEFKDIGLMEPKSLVLAGETLFGLSEKGVWKWNKNGLKLISDKIISLPDAGVYEYIGFYNSIRNQYLLHRQESSGSIYQMTKGSQVALAGGDSAHYARLAMLDETRFALLHYESIGAGFPDDLKLVIGTIGAGGAITYGTPVVLGSCRQYCDVRLIDTDKLLVGYSLQGSGHQIRVANVSGTTITLGTEYAAASGNEQVCRIAMMSSSTFVLFHAYNGYYTGSISGDVITLNTIQTGYLPGNVQSGSFDARAVEDGYGIIAYACTVGGTFGSVVGFQDNGDGTISLGAAKATIAAFNYFGEPCLEIFNETTFAVSHCNYDGANKNLMIQPASFDKATLTITLGTAEILTGAGNVVGGYGRNTIARASTSAFWLFYEDGTNSEKPTVLYGAISPTAINFYTLTKEVVQDSDGSHTLKAIRTITGQSLLAGNTDKSNTSNGWCQVWGVDYAAINTFVYHIDEGKWMKFLGLDIADIPVILSGGSLDENYNIWLDSYKELQLYPGSAYTSVDAYVRTKEYYIQEGVFQRWLVDFDGDADVETRVNRRVGSNQTQLTDSKYDVNANQWRGLSLENQRGRSMSIKIIGADVIKALNIDVKGWGER